MKQTTERPHKNKVHKILAHSYFVYFIFFLAGVYLDIIFKIKIFNDSVMAPLGAIVLLLASLLILWAQKTSRSLKKNTADGVDKEDFYKGPYRYTRSPTHYGLFFLMLGFGITANAFFVILSTLVALFVTKFIFIDKQEEILAEKYGAPYLEYKKSVKF